MINKIKNIFNKKNKDEKQKQKQKQLEGVQNWLPVNNIDDGIVYLKDNTITGIIEIIPINMSLLKESEKRDRVEKLIEFLNSIDFNDGINNIAINSIGKPIDLEHYLDWIQDKVAKEENALKKKLLLNSKRTAKNIVLGGETIEKKYYLVINQKINKKNLNYANDFRAFVYDYENKIKTLANLNAKVLSDDEIIDYYSLFISSTSAEEDTSINRIGTTVWGDNNEN